MRNATRLGTKCLTGVSLVQNNELEKGLVQFRSAIADDLENYRILNFIGEVYRRLKDYQQAEVMLNRAADMFATARQPEMNLDELQKMCNEAATDSMKSPFILYSQARLARDMGEFDEAFDLIEKLAYSAELNASRSNKSELFQEIKSTCERSREVRKSNQPKSFMILEELLKDKDCFAAIETTNK